MSKLFTLSELKNTFPFDFMFTNQEIITITYFLGWQWWWREVEVVRGGDEHPINFIAKHKRHRMVCARWVQTVL